MGSEFRRQLRVFPLLFEAYAGNFQAVYCGAKENISGRRIRLFPSPGAGLTLWLHLRYKKAEMSPEKIN